MRQRRNLKTKSIRNDNPFINTGIRKKNIKANKNSLNVSKKRLPWRVLVIILFIVIGPFSLKPILKAQNESKNIQLQYSTFQSETCSPFEEKLLNSVLNISLDKDGQIGKVYLFIHSKDRVVSLDFTNTKFTIDKAGTQGTIRDYYESNKVYLSKDQITQNLPQIFLKEFFLKVDHLAVTDFNFTKYVKDKIAVVGNTVKSDVCESDFEKLVKSFKSSWKSFYGEEYNSKKTLYDLFDFYSLTKEQARISIVNKSGVEKWGNFTQKLLENYGLVVVKVDDSREILKESKVSIENKNLNSTDSLNQVLYLLEKNRDKPQVKVKESIFATVNIDLGQDSLIP